MQDISFIDSHAHIYLEQFDEDLDAVIERAKSAGLEAVCMPNIDEDSVGRMLGLSARHHGFCYPMIGLHPCSVTRDFRAQLAFVEARLDKLDVVAVGEIGTDRYWDVSLFEEQVQAFEYQIGLARTRQLPIVIHSRDSLDENIAIVEKFQDGSLRGVFHCFTGSVEQGKRIQDLGFYLGIGGVLTFKNSDLKEVVPELDTSRLLLETDAPYLSPVPYRGKRNEPAYLALTAAFLADVLDEPVETIARITTRNARLLFALDRK